MDARKQKWLWGGLARGAGTVTAPRPPVVRAGDRVLLLGDSLARGLAAPLGQLAKATRATLRSDARRGTTIVDWASAPWLDGHVSYRPDLAVVSLGMNDAHGQKDDPAALKVLVARLRALARRVVWLSPPALPFSAATVRARLTESGLDVYPSLALTLPRAPDGVQITAFGYAAWAGAVWAWLGAAEEEQVAAVAGG